MSNSSANKRRCQGCILSLLLLSLYSATPHDKAAGIKINKTIINNITSIAFKAFLHLCDIFVPQKPRFQFILWTLLQSHTSKLAPTPHWIFSGDALASQIVKISVGSLQKKYKAIFNLLSAIENNKCDTKNKSNQELNKPDKYFMYFMHFIDNCIRKYILICTNLISVPIFFIL